MDHQDWNTIILRTNKKIEKQQQNVYISKEQKLAKDVEPEKPAQVSKQLAQKIISARCAKKWSRKDLALAINEQESLIARYETSKEIPKTHILQKMRKVLCCQLPSN